MSLADRRNNLVQQINKVEDEQTLEMLEASLAYYNNNDGKDITDGLDNYQLAELNSLLKEPDDKDTISEEEFKKLFARWNTK
jgi:hypothetical protein